MDREDDAVKLNLRLDEPTHRLLTAEAKRSVRSLHSEIVHRLRESLKQIDQHDREGPAP
jgi:predicted HicB family RNase H-like nuclease